MDKISEQVKEVIVSIMGNLGTWESMRNTIDDSSKVVLKQLIEDMITDKETKGISPTTEMILNYACEVWDKKYKEHEEVKDGLHDSR